jgi:hypothetical protein
MSDKRLKWWTRFLSAVQWDGCLPLVGACSRGVLPFLVGRDLADPVALIIVTPAIALARSHYGSQQLQKACSSPGLTRQMLFASAIIALMLFEGLSVALFAARPPLAWWIGAAAMYFVYLVLVMIALRPSHDPRP